MSGEPQIIKIGTRGSPLAMIQANMVADLLRAAHGESRLIFEIIPIKSAADWQNGQSETPLSEADGGKGLFAKEIEQALLAGEVDCGVHSMKDMDSTLPDGLVIDHVLPRENPYDAMIAPEKCETLGDLPQGASVGTSSVRRAALLKALRPDLDIVPFRGNVGTRLEKMRAGQVDATILAMAGLNRMGLADEAAFVFNAEEMLPAACQGIIGIETRRRDIDIQNLLTPLHCHETGLCAAAERAAVSALGGTCHTPLAVFARLQGGEIYLRCCAASHNGASIFREEGRGHVETVEQAQNFGLSLGQCLKEQLPDGFLL